MPSSKYLTFIILCFAMIIGLVACTSPNKTDSSDFRTPKIFNEITEKTGLHMDVHIEDKDTELEVYQKKNDFYARETENTKNGVDGDTTIIISDGETMSVLDPKSGTAVQTEIDQEAQKQIDSIAGIIKRISEAAESDEGWTKDAVKIHGMEFDAEISKNDKQETKFLYNDDGKLSIIVAETDSSKTVMEVKVFDNDIPEDIFKIPGDYIIK